MASMAVDKNDMINKARYVGGMSGAPDGMPEGAEPSNGEEARMPACPRRSVFPEGPAGRFDGMPALG